MRLWRVGIGYINEQYFGVYQIPKPEGVIEVQICNKPVDVHNQSVISELIDVHEHV